MLARDDIKGVDGDDREGPDRVGVLLRPRWDAGRADAVGARQDGDTVIEATEAGEQRLVQIELVEIPRVRSALTEWADDGLLVAKLREFEREADRLRERLGVDRSVSPAAVRDVYDAGDWFSTESLSRM